jgi:hypothetical protein
LGPIPLTFVVNPSAPGSGRLVLQSRSEMQAFYPNSGGGNQASAIYVMQCVGDAESKHTLRVVQGNQSPYLVFTDGKVTNRDNVTQSGPNINEWFTLTVTRSTGSGSTVSPVTYKTYINGAIVATDSDTNANSFITFTPLSENEEFLISGVYGFNDVLTAEQVVAANGQAVQQLIDRTSEAVRTKPPLWGLLTGAGVVAAASVGIGIFGSRVKRSA